MDDGRHVRCRGEVRVPLPPEEAIELFTPLGERRWVPGWEPVFPAEGSEREPGTVFTTVADGRLTIWVVVAATNDTMGYARVTPGVQAGTVEVRCRREGDETVAEVAYELTALEADARLDEFAAGFEDSMREWQRLIRRSLEP